MKGSINTLPSGPIPKRADPLPVWKDQTLLVLWIASGNSSSLRTNPFRSNLITQILIWKHLSFPSRLLWEKLGSGKLPPAGKINGLLPPEQSGGRRNASNSRKSSHWLLPPLETTTQTHIKASCQLPRERINSLTETSNVNAGYVV